MNEYIVSVTREDIRRGEQNDRFKCPISLAIKESGIKDIMFADVGSASIEVYLTRGRTVRLENETSLQRWIDDFDSWRKSASPLSVRLDFEKKMAGIESEESKL